MIFYKYTLTKMTKSISTYIIGAIVLASIWITVLTSISAPKAMYTYPMVIFLTFPVFIIFITFKVSQIFRDEIENNTLLILQSKPILKRNMIWQGIFAVLTLVGVLSMIGSFLPLLVIRIAANNSDGGYVLYPLITMMTQIFLSAIIITIALSLSLALKGKAFIGIMLGVFGIGFYLLFGVGMLLKASNTLDSQKYNVNNNANWTKVDNTGNPANALSADEIYNMMEKVNKKGAYDYYKWVDPATHWMIMFGGGTPSDKSSGSAGIIRQLIEGKSTNIELKAVARDGNNKVTSFEYRVLSKDSVPLWYPFIFWGAIGALLIPLSIRGLNKKNIA